MLSMTSWGAHQGVPIMGISQFRTVGLLLAGSLCSLAPLAAAEKTESAKDDQSANAVLFSAGGDSVFSTGGDRHFLDMQRKLADPRERAALRARMRADLELQHPDIAEELGINAGLAAKLLDLLADQYIAGQDRFFNRRPAQMQAGDAHASMNDMAAAESRDKDQIRQLIGENAFERYLRYDSSSMERQQVTLFTKRLAAADRLSADQKHKLMALTRDLQLRHYETRPRGFLGSPDLGRMLSMSAEERQAVMLRQNIELNEEAVRDMHQEKQSMVERARAFLTPKQLEGYSQWYDDRIANARNSVEKMRVSAGMNATFDEHRPPAPTNAPLRFDGRVRLQVHVQVDGNEPVTVDVTTENGKAPEAFQVAPDLWAEATPVLYADGTGNVMLRYYEERHGTRQPLRGMHGIGISNRYPGSNVPLGSGGGSGSTTSGSKSHAVFMDARLTVAP
jgi:hypothetical protein